VDATAPTLEESMNRPFALLIALVTVFALAQPDDADARRMGGGRSFGAQRSITPAPAPSTSLPSTGAAQNPVMPAQPGMSSARPAAPAAAAAGGASRWLGPIAGIAAGLGLAALFSHLGLSEGFGSLLLMLLLVGAGVFVIRALLARRNPAGAQGPVRYAPQGAAASPRVEPGFGQAGRTASTSRFDTQRIDASRPDSAARAGSAQAFEPAFGRSEGAPAGARRYPPGFEPGPFLAEAKKQFVRMQQAYDRGDRAALADILTPEMQVEIGREIAERGLHVPTEVIALEGEVLEVVTEGDRHWASLRFQGRTREDGNPTPQTFDEVWNLVKPVDGSSGWRLAGIQQHA
jgi:predicted lipid-binding transport protein (Tim44 family)